MQSKWPHLANAPIQEALLDWRVVLPEGFNVQFFEPLKDKLAEEFPQSRVRRERRASLHIKGPESTISDKDLGVKGYILSTSDSAKIAQFRLDGFTFNLLKPYTSWDEMFSQAWQLWERFLEVASPESVTRIATRFINNFRVSGVTGWDDLSEYLVQEGAPSPRSYYKGRFCQDAWSQKQNVLPEPPIQSTRDVFMTATAQSLIMPTLLGDDRAVSEEAERLRSHRSEIRHHLLESITLGSPHLEAIDNLEEAFVESSKDDWDGYGAERASWESFERALKFLNLLPTPVATPEVSVEPDGEIALEWFKSSRHVLSISVGKGAKLSYAALLGKSRVHGTEPFSDELPEQVIFLLRRFASQSPPVPPSKASVPDDRDLGMGTTPRFEEPSRSKPLRSCGIGRLQSFGSDSLTVELDNEPPGHANLTGWPKRKDEQKMLAMELAAQAALKLVPK